jgi:hypothetical protein
MGERRRRRTRLIPSVLVLTILAAIAVLARFDPGQSPATGPALRPPPAPAVPSAVEVVAVLPSEPEPPAEAVPGLAERLYDVRDLLIRVPDFNDGPTLGIHQDEGNPPRRAAGPGGLFAGAPDDEEQDDTPTREELVAELIDWVRSSVPPDESRGLRLTEQAGYLRVTAGEAAHARLDRLVGRVRARRHRQVMLEARFIRLTPTSRASLDATLEEKVAAASAPGGKGSLLEDEEVDALLRALQADRVSTLVTGPRVTLFDGQRAYVLVANQRAYVCGHDRGPLNAEGIAAPFTAKIGTVDCGVLLDARAACDEAGEHVALDAWFQLVDLVAMNTKPFGKFPDDPAAQALQVQEPVIREWRIDQTLSIPNRRSLLLCAPELGNGAVVATSAAGTRPGPATAPFAAALAPGGAAGAQPPGTQTLVVVKTTVKGN